MSKSAVRKPALGTKQDSVKWAEVAKGFCRRHIRRCTKHENAKTHSRKATCLYRTDVVRRRGAVRAGDFTKGRLCVNGTPVLLEGACHFDGEPGSDLDGAYPEANMFRKLHFP